MGAQIEDVAIGAFFFFFFKQFFDRKLVFPVLQLNPPLFPCNRFWLLFLLFSTFQSSF
jgi:uncharacterized membrane protein YhfC